jgi:hypothetical protein
MNQNKKFINVRKCDDHEQHQRYIESMLYLIKKHFELEKTFTHESVKFLRDNVDEHEFLKSILNRFENEKAFVNRRIMYVKKYDTQQAMIDDTEKYNENLKSYSIAKVSHYKNIIASDHDAPFLKFVLNFDVNNRSSFMYVVSVGNNHFDIVDYDVYSTDIRERC